MQQHLHLLWLVIGLSLVPSPLKLKAANNDGDLLIGVGSYDMTGPAAGVNMMGYANMDQVSAGIHFRLRARTFIVAENNNSTGARFAFVNLDAGMASQLVTIKVMERLKARYATEGNVAISGIHTHAGPGGYLQYLVYSVTSLGFVRQSFDVIVNAIEQSIVQAHNNLRPGSVFLMNPAEERARYSSNIDTQMTLLKLWDEVTQKSIGAFNWFPTHGTSMSRNNSLISGDNKGAAARFFEDWFTHYSAPSNHTVKSNTSNPLDIGQLMKKARDFKASGGEKCEKTTSEAWKVRRMSNGPLFVGAFCQTNVGDVSPNVLGAFCSDTGNPCDFNRSSCHGNDLLCVGRGPGYPDEIKSTKMIGERQFNKAVELFNSATLKLSGKIDYRHVYLNFTNIPVQLGEKKTVRTCPAALGPGFAAGTTDGPGHFGFQQGDKEINPFWKMVSNSLKEPSQYQVECQKPKPILLDTGEMFDPYPWAPAILPIQMLRLGELFILSVPGEFTTMAGRRLREAVKETLVSNGNEEFDNQNTHVVIAGLTNAYSQYIATFEEYEQQRYEASSTLYGPHTLSAYIQEFKKLATSMAKGEKLVQKHPSPPDLSSAQIGLSLEPLGDSPPKGKSFGDIYKDVVHPKSAAGSFVKGSRASATFWSANPRYDLLTGGTFAAVEKLDQDDEYWVPSYDDDDFCLYFKWEVVGGGDHNNEYKSFGVATIEWEVPEDVAPGVYRLRHFGSAKETIISPIEYYTELIGH